MTRSRRSGGTVADAQSHFAEVLAETETLIPQLHQMVGALNALTDQLAAQRAADTPDDGATGE